MSRQPKKGCVGNQNESESTTKSAESATKKALSRQPKKRHFGNQKPKSSKIEAANPIPALETPFSFKIEAVALFETPVSSKIEAVALFEGSLLL